MVVDRKLYYSNGQDLRATGRRVKEITNVVNAVSVTCMHGGRWDCGYLLPIYRNDKNICPPEGCAWCSYRQTLNANDKNVRKIHFYPFQNDSFQLWLGVVARLSGPMGIRLTAVSEDRTLESRCLPGTFCGGPGPYRRTGPG